MKCIIDTHALLWIVTEDAKLSKQAKNIYLNSGNTILFSLASIWEMAIKISLNKLLLEESLNEFIQNQIKGNDIKILNIDIQHVLSLENLPFHHRDPFDRLIISQCINENIPILSSDKLFDPYPVKRIW
jgi:PIN domain nuclease of toxin-antitoxin system